jgi:type IV pilus assembly protein PilO
MGPKEILAKLNEIDLSEIDLNDIDFSSAGVWPTPAKVLVGGIVFLAVLLAGYFFLVTDLQSELDRAVQKEGQLKTEFKEKYRQAVHLEAYRTQALEMEESFKQILSQLPSDTEIPGLIEDISKVGSANGLVFTKIALMPEEVLEFYIEKPIRIEVVGGYHSLGAFVSDVADLSRIVTLHDFQIQPQGGGRDEGGTLLKMGITAKTYRYKDGVGS